jgi:hypothetical protein
MREIGETVEDRRRVGRYRRDEEHSVDVDLDTEPEERTAGDLASSKSDQDRGVGARVQTKPQRGGVLSLDRLDGGRENVAPFVELAPRAVGVERARDRLIHGLMISGRPVCLVAGSSPADG